MGKLWIRTNVSKFAMVAVSLQVVTSTPVIASEQAPNVIKQPTQKAADYGTYAGVLGTISEAMTSEAKVVFENGARDITLGDELFKRGSDLLEGGFVKEAVHLMQEGASLKNDGIDQIAKSQAMRETASGFKFMQQGALKRLNDGAGALSHVGNAVSIAEALTSDMSKLQGSQSTSYLGQLASRVGWDVIVGIGPAVVSGDWEGAVSGALTVATKSFHDIGAAYIQKEEAWAQAALAEAGLRETEIRRFKNTLRVIDQLDRDLQAGVADVEDGLAELEGLLEDPRSAPGLPPLVERDPPAPRRDPNDENTQDQRPTGRVTAEEAERIRQSVEDATKVDYPTADQTAKKQPSQEDQSTGSVVTGGTLDGTIGGDGGFAGGTLGAEPKQKPQLTEQQLATLAAKKKAIDDFWNRARENSGKPVEFDAPEFDAPEFDAPEVDPVVFSGFDFSEFDDSNTYPGSGQFDGFKTKFATDTGPWDEWIEKIGRAKLEALASKTPFMTLATALGRWKDMVREANDPKFVAWAMTQPAPPNIQSRWQANLSWLKLAQLIAKDFSKEVDVSGELPTSLGAYASDDQPRGYATNWANVKIARGSTVGILSNNVSHIGSPAGSGALLPFDDYNSAEEGLIASASGIVESPFFIVEGNPATNLGEGRTFGPITAPAGGPIFSVNNAGQSRTVVEKTFRLPSNQRNFTFQTFANFVTTEFPEFVGTQFDDTGRITLITPAGQAFNVETVFSQSVNQSTFTPVNNLPDPLGGTAGQTGFQRAGVNRLPVAPGGTVTLRIEVDNVGDELFPSAVLFNNPTAQ
ncbi:MAG: hypothetical protein AAF557_23410 [Pseudomonadota bacterium]